MIEEQPSGFSLIAGCLFLLVWIAVYLVVLGGVGYLAYLVINSLLKYLAS